MSKGKLPDEQKRVDADLWIIVITFLVVLGIYTFLSSQIVAVIKDNSVNILLRVLLGATFQLGIAGLGITIVSIFRKESFLPHGLKKKGLLLSVILSMACFLPQAIFLIVTNQVSSYLPFQSVWTTKDVLESGFPTTVIGMGITALAWGFFEGFNYVVISNKINERYPSRNKWLNWGAISSAIFCLLIHGAIGVTLESVVEMLTISFFIYGMLMVKEWTGNAWGCVAAFVLLWNAF